MTLRSVHIENFRGLRRLEIDLEAGTTVVIGENDTGKSSLFAMLDLCLGLEQPEGRVAIEDADAAPGGDGPIRVQLDFSHGGLRVEKRADAAPLVELAGVDSLDDLRARHPLLLLRSGLMGYRHAVGCLRQRAPSDDHLAERVSAAYARLLEKGAAHARHDVAAGFSAAAQLLERGVAPALNGAGNGAGEAFSGSGAQQIAVLAVVGALLDARLEGVGSHADPILLVEDPETHLHPLTLAAAVHILDGVPWQTVVATHSEFLLTRLPLEGLRRLERRRAETAVFRVDAEALGAETMRRIGYHVRARRGAALFARCWLLVEGETEFWLLPEMARLMGYDLALEGVVAIEFAQCGVAPLVKLADQLGIDWRLLADGDRAGQAYAAQAAALSPNDGLDRVTLLEEKDVETTLTRHGLDRHLRRGDDHSKPGHALAVVEAAAARGAQGVPARLAQVIESCVKAARRFDGSYR